jgi:hypothetical protein
MWGYLRTGELERAGALLRGAWIYAYILAELNTNFDKCLKEFGN